MTLWAVYSDRHPEVDVGGDRVGLLGLATALFGRIPNELNLDAPPTSLQTAPSLRAIRVKPNETPNSRIRFSRDGQALTISGRPDEMGRILAASITQLANGPSKINTVGAHLHLDPTSDPERSIYTPDSISLVVQFIEPTE